MARPKPRVWIVCAWLASVGLDGPAAMAQESKPPGEGPGRPEARKAAWLHETYLQDASGYDFRLDEPGRPRLELRREPAMRWTSGNDYNGEVYVWTHRGAAKVVGCMFSRPQGDGARLIMHEFHSLTPGTIVAEGGRGSGWQPQEAGIKPEPIPEAPEPARTPARRLTQMRDLARGFTAQVDRGNARSEMRLLPQPIYRYAVADEGSSVVDGAVFAYVWSAGTDPELLLVIEALRTEGGVRWHSAPARFTNKAVWVKYQDREVWRADAATAGLFDGVTTRRYGAFSLRTVADPGQGR